MQGHRDIPLNDQGLNQAGRIARRLSDERWDAIISSDLKRAAVTADIIAATAAVPSPIRDQRLRERSFGRLEGTTNTERELEWGKAWIELEHGVESDESLFQRGSSFLEDMKRLYTSGSIIVVTHGGWIRQMFRELFPEMAEFQPGNTAMNRIRFEDGEWRCLLYNCTLHLNNDDR